jgi:hypothetical protein
MIKKYLNLTTSSFCVFAIITSCSLPVQNINDKNNINYSEKIDKYKINGFADFGESFNTKATIGQVGDRATVSLIYTHDDLTNPNVSIATGLTNTSGNFTINVGFIPVTNKIYLLQASKRIGSSGNRLMSINTYIRWNGSIWESITNGAIGINSKTTAITIIDSYDSSINSNDTINTINSGIVSQIGSVTINKINDVVSKVTSLLEMNTDPIKFIGYQNNNYVFLKESNFAKNYLISNKLCTFCDINREDLSNLNLNTSDISGADLSNSDLSNTDFTNSNFTGVNLDNAITIGTNFSGSVWLDGSTSATNKCITGSIGRCYINDKTANFFKTNNQSNPSLALNNSDNYVVTWEYDSQDSTGVGIYAQRFNSGGINQVPPNCNLPSCSSPIGQILVNTNTTNHQSNSVVGIDNSGNFVIAWQSNHQSNTAIYAQRFNSNGTHQGSEFRVSEYTTGNQFNPSLSMNNSGDFIITWQSTDQDGSLNGIYAKKYNINGVAQIPTNCTAPNCNNTTGEFKVNTNTTNNQLNPSVSINNSGNFVISWQSNHQDEFNFETYAQRFNSNSESQGSEFRVNSYTLNNQNYSSVAMDNNGNFAIAWQSSYQDGSLYGVYAKKYDSNGIVQIPTNCQINDCNISNGEFRVNTGTMDNQKFPSIGMDSNGNFTISWESNHENSFNYNIYAKKYNSNGTTKVSEFRVNTYTTDYQNNSSVAFNSSGNFAIGWDSNTQDTSGRGIYYHKFNSSGHVFK